MASGLSQGETRQDQHRHPFSCGPIISQAVWVLRKRSEVGKQLESFPGGSVVKNLPVAQGTWQVRSRGWEDPRRRKRQPTPVFLPGESHGQRSLAIVHGVTKSQT